MRATDRLISPLRRTTAALIVTLVCAAICVGQAQQPAKVVVEDVIPQGNRFTPPQKIISLIKTRPGAEYSDDTIQEDVRKLYETKLFANVRVQIQRTADDKVKVYFVVAEYPTTVQEVVYLGAKHLKADELETITGIRKGSPLNPVANQIARQAILRRYNEMGRMLASVDLLEGNKPGDSRVVFNITEGPVAKVKTIKYTGCSFVSGARLNTQIDSSREILGLFGGTLDPIRADHDVARLEEYYKRFGYHDVRVSRELQWEEDQRHVRLIFHIQEGPRYRVSSLNIEGNNYKSEDELKAKCKVHPDEYYSKSKVEADQSMIQAAYGYDGRAVTVREVPFTTGPGEVALHYEIQERPPARVGNIYVVGNDTTKQNVILRQVPLYPGQVLTYPDLRLAEKKLAQLNIFEINPATGIRPTVTVIDPDGPGEFKDILVNVQETQTGSLLFGVGVNSDAGLTGSIALNERNFDITRFPTSFEELLSGHAFRGAGQEFRAEAVPGTQLQRYTVSWREPFLFDSPYSLGVSGYYWDRVYNEYTESRLGTRITVGRKLNQYWSVSGTLRIEDVGVHNVQFFEPADIQAAEGQHFLAGVRGGVTRDTRDSYLRPTEGSLIDVSFEQFLGDFTFPQFNAEANQYWTVYERADGSGRHVLAARSAFGWTGSHTPVFERFYAGGFRSMRGFEFRGVGPDINGFKVGGDFEFLNSLEYQIPILANDQLYGVFFVDSGTVESSIEIKNYRVAVGTGLRIVVPMLGPVPIALDFGFPIVKAPQDRDQVFSFWVGFFH
jgi:outer membrane protein assembly complex protein YaeT